MYFTSLLGKWGKLKPTLLYYKKYMPFFFICFQLALLGLLAIIRHRNASWYMLSK